MQSVKAEWLEHYACSHFCMFHQQYTCESLPYHLAEVSVEVACYNTEEYDGDAVIQQLSTDLLRSFPGMKIEPKSLSYDRIVVSLLSINNIPVARKRVLAQLCPSDVCRKIIGSF